MSTEILCIDAADYRIETATMNDKSMMAAKLVKLNGA